MEILNTVNITGVTDRGDGEKILAMLTLGLGSFLAGMLPAVITQRNTHRFPLAISVMLCFGAGILLATALVHILPEVRRKIPNLAEVLLCCGFFIIYFIDEFIHYFFGEAIQHMHGDVAPVMADPTHRLGDQHNQHSHENYGSVESETSPLLGNFETNSDNVRQRNIVACGSSNPEHIHSIVHCDDEVADANARICHTSHEEPCVQSMTGTVGLFAALSLHSLIEGLAIGVQNSASKVLFMLGAVGCHKFVMGFCMGLEFRSNRRATIRSQFIGILVFSLGAVCGIGLGMAIVVIPSSWNSSTLPIIQALAGGTLFYVTVCEVIPRERARWHKNTARKAAGFAQFLAVLSGFITMSALNFYLADDD